MNSAMQIEAQRRAESLARHKERIEWLSLPSPKWADGVPVAKSDIQQLLRQSREIVAFHEQHYGASA